MRLWLVATLLSTCGCLMGNSAGAATRITITGINSRRISSSIVIDRSMKSVWAILTDYDNLANIVPNLVASRRLPNADSIRI